MYSRKRWSVPASTGYHTVVRKLAFTVWPGSINSFFTGVVNKWVTFPSSISAASLAPKLRNFSSLALLCSASIFWHFFWIFHVATAVTTTAATKLRKDCRDCLDSCMGDIVDWESPVRPLSKYEKSHMRGESNGQSGWWHLYIFIRGNSGSFFFVFF